jgi:hypothetical protein
VRPYRFLIDRSVAKAGSLIPTSSNRIVHLREVGLPEDAADSVIVESAALEQAIIVTANGHDFLNAIDRYQKKQMQRECRDLYGLLILPNLYEIQKRFLPGISNKLRFRGTSITWQNVHDDNLCVRLTDDGQVRVTALGRCRYCSTIDPKRPMKIDCFRRFRQE